MLSLKLLCNNSKNARRKNKSSEGFQDVRPVRVYYTGDLLYVYIYTGLTIVIAGFQGMKLFTRAHNFYIGCKICLYQSKIRKIPLLCVCQFHTRRLVDFYVWLCSKLRPGLHASMVLSEENFLDLPIRFLQCTLLKKMKKKKTLIDPLTGVFFFRQQIL